MSAPGQSHLRRRGCSALVLVPLALIVPFTAAWSAPAEASATAGITLTAPTSVRSDAQLEVSVKLRANLAAGQRAVLQRRSTSKKWTTLVTGSIRKKQSRLVVPAGAFGQSSSVVIRAQVLRKRKVLATSSAKTVKVVAAPGPALVVPVPGALPAAPAGDAPPPTSSTATSNGGPLTVSVGGTTATAAAGSIRAGETLTLSRGLPAGTPARGFSSLGDGPFELTTSQGQPNGPVDVAMRYAPASLAAGDSPLVFHGHADKWRPEITTDDRAAGIASATVTSFSGVDLGSVLEYGAGFFTGNRTDRPTDCLQGVPPDWLRNVTLSDTASDVLPMCLGAETNENEAFLHIVNNRGYAQAVEISGAEFEDRTSADLSSVRGFLTRAIAAKISGGQEGFILMPQTSSAVVRIARPPAQPSARTVRVRYMSGIPTGMASIVWAVAATIVDEVPVADAEDYIDCLAGALDTIIGQNYSQLGNAVSLVQTCSAAVKSLIPKASDEKTKRVSAITLAIATLNFGQKLIDAQVDALYPPSNEFVIRGTGEIASELRVGPRALGVVPPGETSQRQLTASGGTPPYTFHLAGVGSPPRWATISTSGLVTITPPAATQGSVTLYAWVSDSTQRHSPFAQNPVSFSVGDPAGDVADVELAAEPSLRIDGAAGGDQIGFRYGGQAGPPVGPAGDVNGDGIDDLIVGAMRSNADAGAAYVVFGRASPAAVDLATLGSGGFRIDGGGAGSLVGASVSGAGDFNGDGLADVIVGAYESGHNSRTGSGSAYVVFGKSTATTVDLGNLGNGGLRIDGPTAQANLGWSVAGIGDVNGDGRPDVAVGAPRTDRPPPSEPRPGAAFVVFGSSATGSVDAASLEDRGFGIYGSYNNQDMGWSVAGAGDFTGDGLADFAVGAPGSPPGTGYIIGGTTSPADVFPGADILGAAHIVSLGGAESGENAAGYAVAGLGDIDQDGRDDVAVGAPFGAGGVGSVYVVYGRADATSFTGGALGNSGYRLVGPPTTGGLGMAVAPVGDRNGDGRADFVVGDPRITVNGIDEVGGGYLVFGGRHTGTVELANLAGAGYRVLGETHGDATGFSVAGTGDANLDGLPDMIVAAWGANRNGRQDSGTVYVR